jgi:hypothetical protein
LCVFFCFRQKKMGAAERVGVVSMSCSEDSSPRRYLVQSEWCVVPTPALHVSKNARERQKS